MFSFLFHSSNKGPGIEDEVPCELREHSSHISCFSFFSAIYTISRFYFAKVSFDRKVAQLAQLMFNNFLRIFRMYSITKNGGGGGGNVKHYRKIEKLKFKANYQ